MRFFGATCGTLHAASVGSAVNFSAKRHTFNNHPAAARSARSGRPVRQHVAQAGSMASGDEESPVFAWVRQYNPFKLGNCH